MAVVAGQRPLPIGGRLAHAAHGNEDQKSVGAACAQGFRYSWRCAAAGDPGGRAGKANHTHDLARQGVYIERPFYRADGRQPQSPVGRDDKDGIIIFDYATGQPLEYIAPEQRPFHSQITQLCQDKDGLVWILTKAEGLAICHPVTLRSRYFKQNYAASSLSGNTCYAILEDNSGIVWIGTNGDINQYDRTKHKFEHYHHTPLEPNSLSDNMVRSIYPDKNGLVWCGTNGGVINLIDPQSDSVGHIPVTLAGKHDIIVPFAFAERNDNEMFVGTSDGLLIMQKATHTFSYYKPLEELTHRAPRTPADTGRRHVILSAGRAPYCS